jgi:hypothetical protein
MAGPALAADPSADLGVTFTGSTIAADSSGKLGFIHLTNHGPSAATNVVITFDVSGLDESKIDFFLGGICTHVGDTVTCPVSDDALAGVGGTADLEVPLGRQPGASGAAGNLVVSVSSDTADPVSSNNSATAAVSVGNSGVDLIVEAEDVYADPETRTPINPGANGELGAFIANMGDLAAVGLTVTVHLPEHTTLATTEPGCVNAADARSTVCTYNDVVLQPVDVDSDHALLIVVFPITVAADAPGPGALPDGTVAVEAHDSAKPTNPDVPSLLPSNVKWRSLDSIDIDTTDNTDGFAVFVAAPAPPLPVTGFKAGLYGGIGAAAVALGVVLFLVGRRRRTRMVTSL